ncbi:hypothetical protein [Paraflavitalea speifideaquila]|uniref:hypothetical protein n=1 Tax=Paraflavitalea speifideaquila TaxID=3076558 RepID=UPI0028E215F8|nr:hypothetical protein [Paraflavitalea speifideiaquila]
MSTRRGFLKSGGLALFGIGVGGVPTFIARAANSQKIIGPYKRIRYWFAFSSVAPWMV